jgi:hypothetical protein
MVKVKVMDKVMVKVRTRVRVRVRVKVMVMVLVMVMVKVKVMGTVRVRIKVKVKVLVILKEGMDMTDIDFRKQIKDTIDDLSISIAMVARRADCNHQTLYNYLKGKSDFIHSDILTRILNALQEIREEKQKTFIRLRDKERS